ncbi:MAG: RidA family protein [Nitrospinota bacterium]
MELEKEVITTDRAAPPVGPYSLGIKTGNLLFISGSVGWDTSGKVVGDGGAKAQTRQAFENIRAVLEAAGGSMENVVKVTVFLTDPEDYPAMNEVRAEHFPKDPPASSAFVVKRLIPPGLCVEIEAIAVLG